MNYLASLTLRKNVVILLRKMTAAGDAPRPAVAVWPDCIEPGRQGSFTLVGRSVISAERDDYNVVILLRKMTAMRKRAVAAKNHPNRLTQATAYSAERVDR